MKEFNQKIELNKCKNLADEIADRVKLYPELYHAICNTVREPFVPILAHAYKLDAMPILANQWISSPLTVAKMTLALECQNIDKVLEIGCGSGYQAAILSKIARRVFTIERIEKLSTEAKLRFKNLNLNNISVRYDDGQNGWKTFAPFERIIFSASIKEIPQNIFDQLEIGGILVAPIEKNEKQYITKFTKDKTSHIKEEVIEECLFVPVLNGRS